MLFYVLAGCKRLPGCERRKSKQQSPYLNGALEEGTIVRSLSLRQPTLLMLLLKQQEYSQHLLGADWEGTLISMWKCKVVLAAPCNGWAELRACTVFMHA